MTSVTPESVDVSALRESLKQVSDPEIGVNIVDLGLVYRLEADAQAVYLDLGMTSPACPMWEMMAAEAEEVLRSRLPPSLRIEIAQAAEPEWQPEMMSERARGILGW